MHSQRCIEAKKLVVDDDHSHFCALFCLWKSPKACRPSPPTASPDPLGSGWWALGPAAKTSTNSPDPLGYVGDTFGDTFWSPWGQVWVTLGTRFGAIVSGYFLCDKTELNLITCLTTYLTTYLRTYLLTCLPTHIPTRIPTL